MRLGARLAALALALAGWVCAGVAPAAEVDRARLSEAAPAAHLSDYRLFEDTGGRRPSRGVIAYAVNTPLFTDYAAKARYLYLPPGASIPYARDGVLDLPVGAVLIKTFAYPADFRRPARDLRLVETRLLIRQTDGWRAASYVWNADQTDALLRRAGARFLVRFVDVAGQPRTLEYAAPNLNQCKQCHGQNGVLGPIGLRVRNLNGDIAPGGRRENQLTRLARLGLLTGAPPAAEAPRTPRWDDTALPIPSRARAYLDANCGHCHSRGGLASNSGLYLTLEETDPHVLGVGKRPVAAGRGSGDLEVSIDPGKPDRSILLYRMSSVEPGVMMPQLGRSLPHAEGIALIRTWIAGMAPEFTSSRP